MALAHRYTQESIQGRGEADRSLWIPANPFNCFGIRKPLAASKYEFWGGTALNGGLDGALHVQRSSLGYENTSALVYHAFSRLRAGLALQKELVWTASSSRS